MGAVAVVATAVPLVAVTASPAAATAQPAVPVISSLSISGYPKPAVPTITVQGSGFGSAPENGIVPSTLPNCGSGWSGTGLDYGKSTLWLLDASQSFGLYGAWQDGADLGTYSGNCEGVVIQKWTSTQIIFGLGSRYPAIPGTSLTSGNTVCVQVKGVTGCLQLP
jgi:hypothetical protein